MRAEDIIQKSIVGYLETVVPRVFVFAVPNAARRGPGQRAGNAVPGLKAGVPDVCFIVDRRPYFVEVKRPDGSGLSDKQVECHREMRQLDIDVTTVTSIEELRFALADWGIKTREATHA